MLAVKNISMQAGGKEILDNVSFEVQQAEFFVILGSNGAGKSTLLKMLTRQETLQSGSIDFKGKSLKNWSNKELALCTAVMHQQHTLNLPFTVYDVVLMGRYPHFKKKPDVVDEDIVADCLEKVGISHLKERNYLSLSGGEQQRVHLARVFAQVGESKNSTGKECKFLFMDEPSNNLDIRYQHSILNAAREFVQAGNTVVAILHDLNLAIQYADRIMLMKHGAVKALGNTPAILNEQLLSDVYDTPMKIFENKTDNRTFIWSAYN